MKKEEFRFRSTNDAVDIRAVRYIPEGEIKAVLQIAHGMVEFIDRYEPFAKFLTADQSTVKRNGVISEKTATGMCWMTCMS